MVLVSKIIVLKNNHVKSEFSGRITLALAGVCATARFLIWKFNRIKDPTPTPPPPQILTSAAAFDTAGSLTRAAAKCIGSILDSVTASTSPHCAAGPCAPWPLTFLQTSDTFKKAPASDPPPQQLVLQHRPRSYTTALAFQSGSCIVVSGAPSRRRAQSSPEEPSPYANLPR